MEWAVAQMGAHAGQQFLDAKRFGHVVVGPGVESLHLGALVIANGEDQHGCAAARADGAGDFNARHSRHHQVGHYQVGGPLLVDQQTLLGIVGGAHVVALRGERRAQHARDLRLVVDDQNSSRHPGPSSIGRLHHRAVPL